MKRQLSPSLINHVVKQRAGALSAGIVIVRKILKEHQFPNGFTTKKMFELTKDYPPPPDFLPMNFNSPTKVPRPEHPVRSVNFLKNMILPALQGQHEIVTVSQDRSGLHPEPDLSNLRPAKRQQRTSIGKEFVWKVVPPETRPKAPAPKMERVIRGAEVGAGADISHLNKRRQNTRVYKVAEAVRQLRGEMPFTKELHQIVNHS